MAGRPSKKAQQQPKAFDEFSEEADGFEEDVPNVDAKVTAGAGEKSREERELRKLIGEDLGDLDPPPRRRKTS